MKINKREFNQLLKNNQLAISLIGMSGIGKTYQSLHLKKISFKHKCIDDLIAMNLVTGKTDIASWLGQPDSFGFETREKEYLEQEQIATQRALRDINKNTVIDTTGSVIYLPKQIKKSLKKLTLIIYLQENYALKQQLFKKYVTDPKPVIWGNKFNQQAGENRLKALQRCYFTLLKFRAEKYKKLADIILPHQIINNKRYLSGRVFLDVIRNQLSD
ncbi:MAG: hypothetical protein WC822_02975 [Candidatus Paceibacterota bacterium]|jgi:shikimate kinase